MSADFDPYSRWLGVPQGPRPPDHYTILGITPSAGTLETKQAFARACEQLHIYTHGAQSELASRVLDEVSIAFRTLTNLTDRQNYDATLATRHKPPLQQPQAKAATRNPVTGPWEQVAELITRYKVASDERLLDEAEQIAVSASPTEGKLHLARCAFELGLDTPEFRTIISSYAERKGAVACDSCLAFIELPDAPRTMRLFANEDELRSDLISISIRKSLTTKVTITRHDRAWDEAQPDQTLTQLAAAILASVLLAVVSLPLWCAAVGEASMMATLAVACFVAIGAAATITYKFYHSPFSSPLSVAWTEVVPVLSRSTPSPAATGFVAGLAIASEGRGDPKARSDSVDLAIRTHRAWARAGSIRRDQLAGLYRLAFFDARKRRLGSDDQLQLLYEIWTLCLDGEYSITLLDQVTSNGRLLHLLSHTEVAVARLRILRIACEHHLTVQDLSAIRNKSRSIDEIFMLGAELDEKSVATLISVANPQRWRDHPLLLTTAFDVAAGNQKPILGKWPDLLLYDADTGIALCGRGIYFKGMWLDKIPTIRQDPDALAERVYVDGKPFSTLDLTRSMQTRLLAFSTFCFKTLQHQVEVQLNKPFSTDIDALLFSETIQCTRCGLASSMQQKPN